MKTRKITFWEYAFAFVWMVTVTAGAAFLGFVYWLMKE